MKIKKQNCLKRSNIAPFLVIYSFNFDWMPIPEKLLNTPRNSIVVLQGDSYINLQSSRLWSSLWNLVYAKKKLNTLIFQREINLRSRTNLRIALASRLDREPESFTVAAMRAVLSRRHVSLIASGDLFFASFSRVFESKLWQYLSKRYTSINLRDLLPESTPEASRV